MSEKRDDEGFVKLDVVKGSDADKWITKRRAETPLENSTASKSQAKEEPAIATPLFYSIPVI